MLGMTGYAPCSLRGVYACLCALIIYGSVPANGRLRHARAQHSRGTRDLAEKSSADWYTRIVTEVNQTTVRVRFNLAPAQYNFKEYKITLEYNNQTLVRYEKYILALSEEKRKRGSILLKNLHPATYVVLVEPENKNQLDPRRCSCKDEYTHCTYCTVTESEAFVISNNQIHVPQIPTSLHHVDVVQPHVLSVVLPVLCGTVVAAVALVVILAVRYRKQHQPTEGSDPGSQHNVTNNTNDIEMQELQTDLTTHTSVPLYDSAIHLSSLVSIDKQSCRFNNDSGQLERVPMSKCGSVSDLVAPAELSNFEGSVETIANYSSESWPDHVNLLRTKLGTVHRMPSSLDGMEHKRSYACERHKDTKEDYEKSESSALLQSSQAETKSDSGEDQLDNTMLLQSYALPGVHSSLHSSDKSRSSTHLKQCY